MLELILQLRDLTIADTIHWNETVDDGIYQISFSSFSLKIYKLSIDTIDERIVIQILNENGTIIAEIDDSDIAEFDAYKQPKAWRLMDELYNKARSQALGVEDVINDIISVLKSTKKSTPKN